MSFEIEIDCAARLAVLRGYGETSADEAHASLLELATHAEFQPGFGVLCDLRKITHRPDTHDVIETAKHLVRFRKLLLGRICVVAGEALAIPAELAAALTAAEGLEQRVFSDYEEARAWVLGGGETSSPTV